MSEMSRTPEQLQASDPSRSAWVTANAGSGKTHVLVDRVIRLMLSGADPASILCITYTKAAAAEMSGRLFGVLGQWIGMSEDALAKALHALGEDGEDPELRKRARRLFTQALETPGGLKIQTIHAFCERLLHLFPVEAGLAPGFTVMDERRSADLYARATSTVLTKAESGAQPDLANAFRNLVARLNSEQFDDLVQNFLNQLRDLRHVISELGREGYETLLRRGLGVDGSDEASLAGQLSTIDRSSCQHHADVLKRHGTHGKINPHQLLNSIAKAVDPIDALLNYYLVTNNTKPRALSGLMSKDAATEHPETHDFVVAEQERVFKLFSELNTHKMIGLSADVFVLAKAMWSEVESEKRRLGLSDFPDLISKAAFLLTQSTSRMWVLKTLDPGISHVLLDEAQDTSPDQWEIVLALAEEFFAGQGREHVGKRTLFVVGDQKQSIYSFQGADAVAFTKSRLEFAKRDAGLKAPVELAVSYRSLDNVLAAVDKVFPAEALAHIGISDSMERPHTAFRKTGPGRVELWPLTEEDEAEEPDAWSKPVDRPPQSSPKRKLARQLAAKVQSWLAPHHPRFLQPQNRPVRADDILILFQSRSPLYRMVLAELRRAGVPVAGADRLNLLRSLVVQDLVMLLHWLNLPQDDHALAVILKSPLVPQPLSEEELFHLCWARDGSLLQRLTGVNADALLSLLSRAPSMGPFEVLSTALLTQRTSVVARLGPEALEASNALIDLAAQFEREHGLSTFGFVQWFKATQTTLKRDMDKPDGDLRLMTVHGAKGLQSNIVILADTASIPGGSQGMPTVINVPPGVVGAGLPVWHVSGLGAVTEKFDAWSELGKEAAQHERNRLLYVAMTRAGDELYIAGAKGSKSVPPASWWARLTEVLGAPTEDEALRLGPSDVFAVREVRAQGKRTELPDWVLDDGGVETLTQKERPSTPTLTHAAGAKRGRALHRLYQLAIENGPLLPHDKLQRAALKLGLNAHDCEAALALLTRAYLKPYLHPQGRSEVELGGKLADGRKVFGRADRLYAAPNGVWLLDFKTDRFVPETISAEHEYARQMALYWALLRQAYPGRPVTAALLWTEAGKLEVLPEPLLTAALQEVETPVT